jgi:hypothetical protein
VALGNNPINTGQRSKSGWQQEASLFQHVEIEEVYVQNSKFWAKDREVINCNRITFQVYERCALNM